MGSRHELQELLFQARRAIAFTGAGISAESGIPTYRGNEGVWNRYDPEKYANISSFFKDSSYYWNFFKEVRLPVLERASPNPAHEALASLERQGRLKTVITQNIDGLHQEAGSKSVLELHGNTRRVSCLHCRRGYTLEDVKALIQERLPPTCSACSGALKPEVVFFGEPLSPSVLESARNASLDCDLFLAVGSSLVVQPAASLPVLAKKNGARLVIVNTEPTRLDSLADLVYHRRASTVLGELAAC